MNRIRLQRRIPLCSRFTARAFCYGVGCTSWLFLVCGLLACTPDESPLKVENQRLKKQLQRQEAVIVSLQEGNKILQEQIDRLNQEAREKQHEFEKVLQARQAEVDQLAQGTQAENKKLRELERQNKKLAADVRWLRAQRNRLRQGLTVYPPREENPITIPHPFPEVLTVTESTLTQNGYALLAKMQTDQKAVLITTRKTSPAVSLEVPGFRNQYFVTLERDGKTRTKLWVNAEFEKLASNGVIIQPSGQEIQEIQLRLAQEIQRALNTSGEKTSTAQE